MRGLATELAPATCSPRRSGAGAHAALLALLIGGCTWVTAGDVESRRPDMDDDRDGYTKSEDCDDSTADISPGATEVWYDGIDANCAGDDDFDSDVDGFVADIYVGIPTAGAAESGGLPGGDCNDEDPLAYPDAADEWYDGVDTDCAGDDDHDADFDGYVPVNHEGLATENVPGSGALPGGDCDDTHDDVHPAATDTWYDGVDSDCGGEDDYDADADLYVPDDYVGLDTDYVTDSGGLPGGDCDDEASDVNPGEAEVWYDGVDEDCDDTTIDDDQDADDHAAIVAGGDDCDDTDGETFPDAVETLGDSRDQDCDGGNDTFAIVGLAAYNDTILSVLWTKPHDLVFASNSSEIYLSVAAEQIDYTVNTGTVDVETNYYDSALAFAFDVRDPTTGITDMIDWVRNVADPAFTLTAGHDFVATDDALFGGVGLQSETRRTLRIAGYDLDHKSRFGINYRVSGSGSDTYDDFESISVAIDPDDYVHAWGCETSTMLAQYVWASQEVVMASDDNDDTIVADSLESFSASACALHFHDWPKGTVLSSDGASLDTTTFTPDDDPITLTTTSDSGWAPYDIDIVRGISDQWTVMADQVNDALVIIEPDGSETSYGAGTGPTQVHAVWDSKNDQLVLGWVDDTSTAHMAWGTPSTGFEAYELDVGFGADEAAVVIDSLGEIVMVAVLGGDNVALGMARL